MTERRPGSGGGDDGFEEEDGARAQLEGPEQATSGLWDGLPPFWRTVPVEAGEACPHCLGSFACQLLVMN